MAERANQKPELTEGVDTLQKRGRRRLVGAIALVLLAVIVLPMVFDPEPRPEAPLVNVRIPSEDDARFTPKGGLKPVPEPQSAAQRPAEAAPDPAPLSTPAAPTEQAKAAEKSHDKAAKPAVVPNTVPKAAPKPSEPAPSAATAAAPAAVKSATDKPRGEQFVVQVAAFASVDKVREVVDLLKEAGLAHYTESVATSNGQVTRVRIGPFASKEAAATARERVAALGRAKGLALNPATPVAK